MKGKHNAGINLLFSKGPRGPSVIYYPPFIYHTIGIYCIFDCTSSINASKLFRIRSGSVHLAFFWPVISTRITQMRATTWLKYHANQTNIRLFFILETETVTIYGLQPSVSVYSIVLRGKIETL